MKELYTEDTVPSTGKASKQPLVLNQKKLTAQKSSHHFGSPTFKLQMIGGRHFVNGTIDQGDLRDSYDQASEKWAVGAARP